MRTRDVTVVLRECLKAGHPMMLTGKPGVGKSDLSNQAATESGMDMVITHPVVESPTDASGMPWVVSTPNGPRAEFIPIGQLRRLLDATKPTCWLMDDIGQAPPAVQAANMQWLLAREVGGHKLPDCVTIVMATNRRQDRAGVSGILEPVKSRAYAIIEVEPNVDDWSRWAVKAGLAPVVIAYLRLNPAVLAPGEPPHDIVKSPSPRSWAQLSAMYSIQWPAGLETEVYAATVGEGAAVGFEAFVREYNAMVSVDQILMDPTAAPMPTKLSEHYVVATGLAMRASVQNFDRMALYLERMVDGGLNEFAALTVRDSTRRVPGLENTAGMIRLKTSEFGRFILGEYDND